MLIQLFNVGIDDPKLHPVIWVRMIASPDFDTAISDRIIILYQRAGWRRNILRI